MSSSPEGGRLARSFALRLGLWHAALFGLGAAVVLTAVYLLLARALDVREREALEVRAAEYAAAFEFGGAAGLQAQVDRELNSPHVRSLFVRLLGPRGDSLYVHVPDNWIDEESRVLVPDGWGSWEPRRVVTVRVPRDEQRDLAVVSRAVGGGLLLQVARSTDTRSVLLAPLRRTMLIAGPAAVLLAAGAGAWVAWRATRPVRAVAAIARRIIATGDLSARVEGPSGGDEIGELVRQFNTLLERNSSLLRALRETLDNVAHDLRTPLTRLRAGAESALQTTGDPAAARAALTECLEETDRIRRLLDTLLDVSAAESGVLPLDRENLPVDRVLAEVADLFAMVAEGKSIRLQVGGAPGVTVWADPVRLRQALANLVDNAVKYTPAGGQVWLEAAARTGSAVITVRDTGPGIPPGEQDKIWRRLYRGDHSRSQRGLGLGLSVVKALIEAHGGRVAVANHPAGGAVFTVELPERRTKDSAAGPA